MADIKAAFSGFSVDDMAKAKTFYTDTLGFTIEEAVGGGKINLPGGSQAWVYAKPDHQPARYTMLNLVVSNIDGAVDELAGKGVVFERYPGFEQDELGVSRGKAAGKGPDIAWFKDPAGNILAILEL